MAVKIDLCQIHNYADLKHRLKNDDKMVVATVDMVASRLVRLTPD